MIYFCGVAFLGFLNFFSSCATLSPHQLSGKDEPDIHCRDSVGNTPLHCAAYRGQKQCIIKLLKSGADPAIKNRNGIPCVWYLLHDTQMQWCQQWRSNSNFFFLFTTHLFLKTKSHKCKKNHLSMAACVAGQTALDLASSEELRRILTAYQDKVGTKK